MLVQEFLYFSLLTDSFVAFFCSSACWCCSCWLLVWWRPHAPHTSLLLIFTFLSVFQIRVVNAFQMDLDSHMDSYDKRSRPSVISLQSLQAQRGAVSKKPMLTSSPEADESASSPWFGRSESIPYADEGQCVVVDTGHPWRVWSGFFTDTGFIGGSVSLCILQIGYTCRFFQKQVFVDSVNVETDSQHIF